jgi:amino acid transporter
MDLPHAVAIGVGGMIGAGVFSVMGVAGTLAGGATFLSFGLAGLLALACSYSFGRLGARYPSAGGPVEFLVKGLGDNALSGGLNILLWLGYVLALALYARAFGAYGATFGPASWQAWLQPSLAVSVTLVFLALNVVGAEAVGRAELLIVASKLVILLGFAAVALPRVEVSRLAPASWPPIHDVGYAAAVVFLSYEGFGLVTNTAEDLRDPARTLPRALTLSVLITLGVYVLVALATLGNLSPAAVSEAREYALAEAIRPTLGEVGFQVIAVAALLSTASAINATLYGGANVSFMIAELGGLPAVFRRRIWQRARGGLFLTAAMVALLAVVFELEGIAMMGSAAFLIVYGAVQAAHARLLDQTGARGWLVWSGLAGCAAVLALLVVFMASQRPQALGGLGLLLVVSFAGEALWRGRSHRRMTTRRD